MTYALLWHALSDTSDRDALLGDIAPRRTPTRDSSSLAGAAAESSRQAADREIDRAIVARVRDGDPTALDALMLRHMNRMGRFATHLLGSRDAAEDVVQDVFVRVWAGRAGLDPDKSIQSFLLTAVRRHALDGQKYERVRERYRAEQRAMAEQIPASVTTGVEEPTTDDARVDALLARLPERQQTALRLRFVEQLTVPEIAQVLAIAPNATHQLIFRGLETLRRTFRPRP